MFRRHFNLGKRWWLVLSRNIILSWIKKFENTGSIIDYTHSRKYGMGKRDTFQRRRPRHSSR